VSICHVHGALPSINRASFLALSFCVSRAFGADEIKPLKLKAKN